MEKKPNDWKGSTIEFGIGLMGTIATLVIMDNIKTNVWLVLIDSGGTVGFALIGLNGAIKLLTSNNGLDGKR